MKTPDEVRDSVALLDILDWITIMRVDPNAQFVMDVMLDHIKSREIVIPCWLFTLILNDLEVYVTDALIKRGIDVPHPTMPQPLKTLKDCT